MTSHPTPRAPSEYVLCVAVETGFRIELGGEIDLISRAHLNLVLDEVTASPPGDILVDLANVSFFGSEGLSFVAGLHNHLVGTDYRVTLHRPNRSTRRCLQLTGFDKVTTITSDDAPDSTQRATPHRAERPKHPSI